MYVCIYLCVGISSSESDLTSDTEERNERSMTGGRYTQGVYVYSDLDGEQILFPESSGEESEWIVSDLEDTTTGTPIGMGGADNEQEDRRWNPIAGAERVRIYTCTYMRLFIGL